MTRAQDLRLLLPAVACWAGAGLGWHPLLLAAAVLTALIWRVPVVAAMVVCVIGGILVFELRSESITTSPIPALAAARSSVVAEAILTDDPHRVGSAKGSALYLVPVRVQRLTVSSFQSPLGDGTTRQSATERTWRLRSPVLVFAHGSGWSHLLPSTRVQLRGQLQQADGGLEAAALLQAKGQPVIRAGPNGLQRAAGRLRSGLRRATAQLPGGADGLLPGLVIGDTSRLSLQDRQDFRTDGLTHLVAVSGTNVTAVLTGVLALMRICCLRRRPAAVAAALALLSFVIVARPSASVVRAAVMGWISLVAWVGGRQRTAAGTLAAAVIVLLLIDPALARSVGFTLSVLACCGLLFLAPGWRDRLIARGWSPAWAEAFAVPTAAQLACTPVIAGIGGGMSLVAIPANLCAAPAVGAATMLGVLTALAAQISMRLATLIADLAALPTLWLLGVAHFFAAVPAAKVPWPSGTQGAAWALLATLVVIGAFRSVHPLRRLWLATELSVSRQR